MRNDQIKEVKAQFSGLLTAAEAFKDLWDNKTTGEIDLVAPEDLPPTPVQPL